MKVALRGSGRSEMRWIMVRKLSAMIGLAMIAILSETPYAQAYESVIGPRDTELRPVTPVDYGSIRIPKESFPRGNGAPIPIYVPSADGGSNASLGDWKTVGEISGGKVRFSTAKLLGNLARLQPKRPPEFPEIPTGAGVDTGAAAAGSLAASLLSALSTAFEENRFRVTVQENPLGGSLRAAIEVFVDEGDVLRTNAGGVVSSPDASNSPMCSAFSRWLRERFGLPETSGYYQGRWFIDRKHKDDPYVAYLALLPQVSAVLISPKVYGGDRFEIRKITNPFQILGRKVLELAGDEYVGVWSYRMPLDKAETLKVLELLPFTAGGVGTSIYAWPGGHTPGHPGVGAPGMPSEEVAAKGPVDLVFCIDCTSSMHDDIDQVKRDARDLVGRLRKKCSSLRIGLVTYRDFAVDGPRHLETNLPLTEDIDKIVSAIQSLEVTGGGDPSEDVLDGLMAAIRMDWRDGVGKFIVLMGDASAKDPDHEGKTKETIAEAARAVDPAHVYALALNSGGIENFREIATLTGGQAFAVEDVTKLSEAIENAVSAAIVQHAGEVGGVGGAIPSDDWQTALLVSTLVGIFILGVMCIAVVIRRSRAGSPLPSDEQRRQEPIASAPLLAWLQVYEPGMEPRNVPVRSAVVLVGRDPASGLTLADPRVSGRHAEIHFAVGAAAVADLGSSNGTLVNGQLVQRQALAHGDHIALGDTLLIYLLPEGA